MSHTYKYAIFSEPKKNMFCSILQNAEGFPFVYTYYMILKLYTKSLLNKILLANANIVYLLVIIIGLKIRFSV